jgi:hypothetical protein
MGESIGCNMVNHVIVSGLGRCGTTMMMKMLRAGGINLACRDSLFEEWLERELPEGRAVKVLGARLKEYITKDCKVIWMTRQAEDHARSYQKFTRALTGIHYELELIKGQMRMAGSGSLKLIKEVEAGLLCVFYESVLDDPWAIAEQVQSFLGERLDIKAMMNAVEIREPECKEGLEIPAEVTERLKAQYRSAIGHAA